MQLAYNKSEHQLDRKEALRCLERIYSARLNGDIAAMEAEMADGATFRFAGEQAMMAAFGTECAISFKEAVHSLDNGITMHSVANETMLVDGHRVAAIWNCTFSVGDRPPFDTQIFNLFTFDATGMITDLTEFVDTAKLAEEVAAAQETS